MMVFALLLILDCSEMRGLWVILHTGTRSGQRLFYDLEHEVRSIPLTGIPPLNIPGTVAITLNSVFLFLGFYDCLSVLINKACFI